MCKDCLAGSAEERGGSQHLAQFQVLAAQPFAALGVLEGQWLLQNLQCTAWCAVS